MRVAIILCLVAAACAQNSGYNYRPGGHSSGGKLSFGPGGGGAATDDSPSFAAFPSSSSGGPSFSAGPSFGSSGPSFSAAPSSGSPSFSAAPSSGSPSLSAAPSSGAPSYGEPEVEVEKEFFTYTADEDEFNEPAANDQVVNSLKKNLRVIFIKGPEGNSLENAVVNVAKHASESKTAIYVLQKHTDLGALANKLQASHDVQHNKPEVHFVKYRTPEDAANAQQAIQSQYDQLGGQSQSHDGGLAPVHNFASPSEHQGHRQPAAAPRASYLPSSIIRRFR